MLKTNNLIASMSTTVTLNVDAPTDIKFGGLVSDMHNRLGATESPTFDNMASADGGWIMELTVTNYGTDIISHSDGVNAKVYTNFQFISMPTQVWSDFIDKMPINTDKWVANNWDDSTQSGFVWQTTDATECAAAQTSEDMILILNNYNFTIPASGGYVIDRLNSATGLFPGQCTIMLTNDFYGGTDVYALGDAFFYAFQGLFAQNIGTADQMTWSVNNNAASGTNIEEYNYVPPSPPSPDKKNVTGIVLGVIGGLLFVVLIGVLVYCYMKKKAAEQDGRHSSKSSNSEPSMNMGNKKARLLDDESPMIV